MNKKYYIYSLITFGLILISYFLYNYFDEKNKNPIEIHIYSFNNSESFTKEQINEIKSYFDENNFSHIIYLHTPKNKNDKEVIILKPSGIRVQDEYKNNFNRAIDSLSKIVYLYPNISKNESNYLVNHFITNVNKGTYKNKRVFVLTGNFPINYTNKDVTELNLKDKLKKKKLDNDN